MRNLAIFTVFVLFLQILGIQPAYSKPANKAEAKAIASTRMIIEYIELGEYETARTKLERNLEALTKAGSATRPIAAETHLYMGIIALLGSKNTKKAKEHFTNAIEIQKNIKLPIVAGKRSKLVFKRVYEKLFPNIDCDELMGLYHQPVTSSFEGGKVTIKAQLGKHLVGKHIVAFYSSKPGSVYHEVNLERTDGCTYIGTIPAIAVKPPTLSYFLEARLPDRRPIARLASVENPFLVNVSFAETNTEKNESTVALEETTNKYNKIDDSDESDVLLHKPAEVKRTGCAGCSTQGTKGGLGLGIFLFFLFMKTRGQRQLKTRR